MSLFSYFRKHTFIASITTVAVVVLVIIVGRGARSKPPEDAKSAIKKVSVVDASSFREGNLKVSAEGTVEAHSQADLRSQTSAPVALVYHSIGDYVYPGEAILELQNADIRAQLDQTRASLTLAQSQYGSSRQSSIDKVRDAYQKADDAVHVQIDPLIVGSSGPAPLFVYYVTDLDVATRIRDRRTDISNSFPIWKAIVDSLSPSSSDTDIHAAILSSQKNLATITKMIDDISATLASSHSQGNSTSQATIAGYQASVSAARAAISAAISSLTSAEASLSNSGQTVGSAASAQVKVAEANIKNLQAQLAKTVITSPISGTIAAMPLRVGELASPGTLLATVVGSGAIEVKAYVSGEDIGEVKVGAAATVGANSSEANNSKIKGIVSNVAPSVSATNRKAEVIIDISNPENSGLVVGDNVSVQIAAALPQQNNPNTGSTQSYYLPIQDIKIVPGNAYIFTVDEKSKIKRNDVVLGEIRGDFVEVKSGLDDNMQIVTPVYELDEGQSVSVQ